MKDYRTIKEELVKAGCSTKYFTVSFYKTYKLVRETAVSNLANGIDDTYTVDGVIKRHAYDEVFKTDFYNKNGCAYCEFLAIIA